jgi:hypothetical protein
MDTIINPNGTSSSVAPCNPLQGYTDAELREIVGGDYKIIDLWLNKVMIVGEQKKTAPLNAVAHTLTGCCVNGYALIASNTRIK